MFTIYNIIKRNTQGLVSLYFTVGFVVETTKQYNSKVKFEEQG